MNTTSKYRIQTRTVLLLIQVLLVPLWIGYGFYSGRDWEFIPILVILAGFAVVSGANYLQAKNRRNRFGE